MGPAVGVPLVTHAVKLTSITASHPVQVRPIALLVFGERVQSNHRACPWSARFGTRWWEPDDLECPVRRALAAARIVDIRPAGLIPAHGAPGGVAGGVL